MKKLLIGCAAFFIGTSTLAETLKVEAITPFTTANAPKSVQVRAIGEIRLTKEVKINSGDILTGCLVDIKDPKRLKRNATFSYEINTITDENGNTLNVKENNIAKYVPSFKLDKVEVAKSAALTVGNHFVEGLSAGYHAVEGAIKDETGNRATSAIKGAYDNSILSYTSKGKDVVINTGDVFGLKIISQDEIDAAAPNYTYE